MPEIPSSYRLVLERAPRLRRAADRVDAQADRSLHPERARVLAREMRLRAAELESGVDDHRHDEEDSDPEIAAIAFEVSG